MIPFVDWLQTGPGFYVNRTWDDKLGEFTHVPGKIRIWPLHEDIWRHCLTIDQKTGKFPYETVVFSAPKKSGKTAWGAAIGAWYSDQSYPGTEIYVLANDMEQAEGRMMRAIKYDAREKGWGDDVIRKYDITYPNTTSLQVLSSHYTSAAGGQQALTLWDELWGYQTEKSQRLWEEMTLIPTEKLGLRVVVTYAGFEGESHLLWDLYEKTVINGIRLNKEFPDLPCYTDQDGYIFAYWDHEPRMPWQTPDYYEAQMAQLRQVNFRRLHLNEWGSMEDIFLPIELWDKATTLEGPLKYLTGAAARNYPISIGVDVGVKRDTSAIVGTYMDLETNRVGLAFHRIWVPTKGNPVNPAELQKFLEEMCDEFKVASIVADPTHFYQNIIEMQHKGLPIVEYKQTPANMVAASMSLFESLHSGMLSVYEAPDLRKHIRFASAKPQGGGYRIVKNPDSTNPIDGAIALAMAAHDSVSRGGYDTTEEISIPSPFSDKQIWKPDEGEEPDWLPEALRG